MALRCEENVKQIGREASEFASIVTLDPQGSQDAWSKLSIFTPALELRELHLRLHSSLVKSIAASPALRNQKVSDFRSDLNEDLNLKSLRAAGL